MKNINYKLVKIIFTYFIIIFVIDATVLTLLKNIWNEAIFKVQKEKAVFKGIYALMSYILMTFGVYYFVYRYINKSSWVSDTLINGFLFGLVLYGVFDMTNLAIFKNYSLSTGLLDICWGSILMSISTFLTYYLIEIRK
jgi:uncharacterized membrane protein